MATKVLPRELHVASIGWLSWPSPNFLHVLIVELLGFASTMGQAGSAAFPFLTGAIAAKSGVKVLQPVLMGLLAGMALFWALIPRVARHSS